MRRRTVFSLETPYREPMDIEGFEFGHEDAPASLAVVGSTRGNEIQQTFICARLVKRLQSMEADHLLDPERKVLVIPNANPYSMNIGKRFWAMDNTDINRMFPGYDAGETTQRIAAGIFEAVQGYEYGVQLASYYLPGDFLSHVRIIRANEVSARSEELADAFGTPCVVMADPSSFDTTTLNFNWQVWDTNTFSLYSRETSTVNTATATFAQDCILRFMHNRGLAKVRVPGGQQPEHLDEADLVAVRTTVSGGFFMSEMTPGARVAAGDELGRVVDTLDAHVKERLVSPVNGYICFMHNTPLVNQYTVAFKIVRG